MSVSNVEGKYPIPGSGDELQRDYRDEAAAQLFKDAGGYELTKALAGLHRALVRQAQKLEEFHSTPFTKQNVRTLIATIETVERGRALLEQWHELIYPQTKKENP